MFFKMFLSTIKIASYTFPLVIITLASAVVKCECTFVKKRRFFEGECLKDTTSYSNSKF